MSFTLRERHQPPAPDTGTPEHDATPEDANLDELAAFLDI
jgi:hypothetical protein